MKIGKRITACILAICVILSFSNFLPSMSQAESSFEYTDNFSNGLEQGGWTPSNAAGEFTSVIVDNSSKLVKSLYKEDTDRVDLTMDFTVKKIYDTRYGGISNVAVVLKSNESGTLVACIEVADNTVNDFYMYDGNEKRFIEMGGMNMPKFKPGEKTTLKYTLEGNAISGYINGVPFLENYDFSAKAASKNAVIPTGLGKVGFASINGNSSCYEVFSMSLNSSEIDFKNFDNDFTTDSEATVYSKESEADVSLSIYEPGISATIKKDTVFIDPDSPRFSVGSIEAQVMITGTDDKRGTASFAHFTLVTHYNGKDDWQGIEIQFNNENFCHAYDRLTDAPLSGIEKLSFNSVIRFKVDVDIEGKCTLFVNGNQIGTFELTGASENIGFAGIEAHYQQNFILSDYIITSKDGDEPIVYRPQLNADYCKGKMTKDVFSTAKLAEIEMNNSGFNAEELTSVTQAMRLSSQEQGIAIAKNVQSKKDMSLTTYFTPSTEDGGNIRLKFLARMSEDGKYAAITYIDGEWGWETESDSGLLQGCLLGEIETSYTYKLEIHIKDNGVCIVLNDFVGYTGNISELPLCSGKIGLGIYKNCGIELYKVVYTDYSKTESGDSYTEYIPDSIKSETDFMSNDQSAGLEIKKQILSSGIDFISSNDLSFADKIDNSTVFDAYGLVIDKPQDNRPSYVVLDSLEKMTGKTTVSFDFEAEKCYDVRYNSGVLNITVLMNYVSNEDFLAINLQGTSEPNVFSSIYVYKNGFSVSNRIFANDDISNLCRMKEKGKYNISITLDGNVLTVKTIDLDDVLKTAERTITLSNVENKESLIGFATIDSHASKNYISNLKVESKSMQIVEFTNDTGKWESSENAVLDAFKIGQNSFVADEVRTNPAILNQYGDISDVKISYDITFDGYNDSRQGGTSSFMTYLRYKDDSNFIAVNVQAGDGSMFSCVYVYKDNLSNRISHNSDNKESVLPMYVGKSYNIVISLDKNNFLKVVVTDKENDSNHSVYQTQLSGVSSEKGKVGFALAGSEHDFSNILVYDGGESVPPSYEIMEKPGIMSIGSSNLGIAFDKDSPQIANFSLRETFKTQDGSVVLVARYRDMMNYVGVVCTGNGDWYITNGNTFKSLGVNKPLDRENLNTVTILSFKNRYFITLEDELIFEGTVPMTTTCAGHIGFGVAGEGKASLQSIEYRALDNSTMEDKDDPVVIDPIGSSSTEEAQGEYVIDFTNGTDLSAFEQEVYRAKDSGENIEFLKGKGLYLNFSGSGFIDRNSPIMSDVDVTYTFSIPQKNLSGDDNTISEVRVGFGFRSNSGSTAYVMNDVGRWGIVVNDGSMTFFKNASLPALELGKTYELRIVTSSSQLAVYMNGVLGVKTTTPLLNIGAGNVGVKTWCNQPLLMKKIVYKAYDPSVIDFNEEHNVSPYFDMENRVGVLPYSDTRLPENTWITVDDSIVTSKIKSVLAKQYPNATVLNDTCYDVKMYLKTSKVVNGSVVDTVTETNKFGGCYLKFMLPEDIPLNKTLRIFKIVGNDVKEQPNIESPKGGGIQIVQIELGKYFITLE